MPPKQYDFSDFDEPTSIPNQDKPNYDFSDFDTEDIANESAMQMDQQEEAPATVSGIPIKESVAGYAAGRAAQEAIPKTGEWFSQGLEKIAELGGTSPEQLRIIKQNFPEFRATDPIAEMNELLATARGTNADINRMYAEAEKLLIDKKITPGQYKNIVQQTILEKDKYGRPVFAKPISQSEIQKADTRVLSNLRNEAIKKEEQMLEEFAKLKANEAVKKADFEYKITNATNQQLPKNIESEIKNNIINQVKTNPQEFGFEGIGSGILGEYDYRIKKEIEELQTPLAKEFPFLQGTSIVPAEERAFQKILKMPSKADLTGDRLQEMLREFRDVGFTEEGQLSDKPAASMSREVRKEIARMSPEAGKLMEAENIELGKLETLEKAGYIKRTGEGLKTTVEMNDTQRNKLVKDLATSYDKASPTDVVENLEVLKNYLPEDQFRKLQLAGMKLAEKRGGGIDYINTNKVNAILQSITKRSVARGIATIPEAIEAALPKAVTSTAKFIGKGAYKALPVVGAGIGGIAAQAAEEALSPETSGALPTMPEYWLERGIRDPEEQLRRSRLASFKEGLFQEGRIDKMPGAYDKPELKEYKEEVSKVEKLGALAPSYVEAPMKKVLKSTNPSEIASIVQKLQTNTDKASQEYARVLNQIIDAPESQKEAALFGLNQQPAFRELVRKIKGESEE